MHNDFLLLRTTLEVAVETPPCNVETYGERDGEHCPECNHAWTPKGPAHFTDCRYFSLDDDRDEQPSIPLWVTRLGMSNGELKKAAA
jgi:hypothetical protein